MMMTMAFSKAGRVMMSRGLMSCFSSSRMALQHGRTVVVVGCLTSGFGCFGQRGSPCGDAPELDATLLLSRMRLQQRPVPRTSSQPNNAVAVRRWRLMTVTTTQKKVLNYSTHGLAPAVPGRCYIRSGEISWEFDIYSCGLSPQVQKSFGSERVQKRTPRF